MTPASEANVHRDDSEDIRSLVIAYAIAVDEGNGEAFAALFDEDGAIERGQVGGVARTHRGRTDLAAVPVNLAAKYDRTYHFIGNHTSVIEGDAGCAMTYCLAHHLTVSRHGSLDHVMFIRYRDELRRGPDARWRFSKREVLVDWTETRRGDMAADS